MIFVRATLMSYLECTIRSAVVFLSIHSSALWSLTGTAAADDKGNSSLRVGFAEVDITPPVGFPIAGYYHERLADGAIDPLKAKAIVFRDGATAAALVVCDLIGIATDLSHEVRRRASEKTGIPASHIAIAWSATSSMQ